MGIGAEGYQPFVKEPSNQTVPVRASYYQSMVCVKGMQKSKGFGGIGCNRKEVFNSTLLMYGLIVYVISMLCLIFDGCTHLSFL